MLQVLTAKPPCPKAEEMGEPLLGAGSMKPAGRGVGARLLCLFHGSCASPCIGVD